MKRTMLMVAALTLLFCGAGPVAAGPILPTHAKAGAFITPDVDNPNFQPVLLEGNGALDTGLLYGTYQFADGSLTSLAARAVTNIQAQHLLRAYSYAAGSGIPAAQAMAAWRDVAFVNSMSHPAALRLNFIVDGTFAATSNPGYDGATASIYITGNKAGETDPTKFFQPEQGTDIYYPFEGPPDAAFYSYHGLNGTSYVLPGFWDSVSFNGTAFHGTFHFDTLYNPNLDGYGWDVALYAYSPIFNEGSATTDFLDTASLQSVTLPDGTPISVTFDSGLQLNAQAVPEPTSLTLLVVGAVCLGGFTWCWRNRASVPAKKDKRDIQDSSPGSRL